MLIEDNCFLLKESSHLTHKNIQAKDGSMVMKHL